MDHAKSKAKPDRSIASIPVPCEEFLETDPRWLTGPAELVENRLHRLLPNGTLPLKSSNFRTR